MPKSTVKIEFELHAKSPRQGLWAVFKKQFKRSPTIVFYLFFSLPLGMTAVMGAMGRSDVEFLGSEVSFLGFFVIFSLRCSPFAIYPPNRHPDMGLQSLNSTAEMPFFLTQGWKFRLAR